MTILNQILETIYLFFPKNMSFADPNYLISLQQKRLLKTKEKHLFDATFKNHLKDELYEVLGSYKIADWTDLKSSNCYEYRILLHKNQPLLDDDVDLIKVLGGKRIDLYLFISILEKFFYFFINETLFESSSNQWEFKKVLSYTEEQKIIINKLRDFMILKGYTEINDDIAQRIVQEVETELLDFGKVKVFNCLFTELISID